MIWCVAMLRHIPSYAGRGGSPSRDVLLLAVLFLLGSCCGSEGVPTPDFTQLRNITRTLATAPWNGCVPEGTVIVTYANQYQFDLLLLQRHALDLQPGQRACLERSFVTVCLDEACPRLCTEHAVPNCVSVGLQARASSYREADYLYIIYVKHEIIEAALGVAAQVLFLDVDAMLLANPWSAKHKAMRGKRYDIRYQTDYFPDDTAACSNSANGGVLLLRNSAAAFRYLSLMKSKKEDILSGTLDQLFIIPSADEAGASHCSLDPTWYDRFLHMRGRWSAD